MKFGMNLLLWTDTLHDGLMPVLSELKSLGYDGVELPIFELDPQKYGTWGKRLAELGLECTAVTVRGPDDNPISPDPKIRAKAVELNKLALECCEAAGAQTLVGPYHSALGIFTGAGPTADEWRYGIETMQKTAEHAQTHGVMLGIEYLNRFECYLLNTAADTARFVREVGHPHCRMMYDTFHSHIEEKDTAAAIKTCAAETVHVHISENDRSTPGAGQVQWDVTFDTLKSVGYDGWLVIEAFGLALPNLVAATKIWRRMYKDEMQLARDGLAFMKQQVVKRA
ncbi:MAG: sugar phosphate isomerase/epimerase [Pirellulales bacterium]|nr:sugar phosphate isomerase/epimerase [Pirellulales bacterium]